MQIRLLHENDLSETLDLVWHVFQEFEVPLYPPKGIKSFQEFIAYSNILSMYQEHKLIFWGCFHENQLIGTIALRGYSHVSLLFVKKEWHHRGVATYLFRTLYGYVTQHNQAESITVNSSPYAIGFYKRIGFQEMSPEKEVDGIRFTPMEYFVRLQQFL